MLRSVTSFSRSGVSDWLLQRASAVVLLAWTLCIGGFLLSHPGLDHARWSGYMGSTSMQIFSLLALFSLVAHAWIGLWSVSTDYLTVRLLGPKATALRILFQGAFALFLFACLVWGILILWGN